MIDDKIIKLASDTKNYGLKNYLHTTQIQKSYMWRQN